MQTKNKKFLKELGATVAEALPGNELWKVESRAAIVSSVYKFLFTRLAGLHARPDYNERFVDMGDKPVPRAEPVFLLRGQDKTAAQTLGFWSMLNKAIYGDENLINYVEEHERRMRLMPEARRKAADYLPKQAAVPAEELADEELLTRMLQAEGVLLMLQDDGEESLPDMRIEKLRRGYNELRQVLEGNIYPEDETPAIAPPTRVATLPGEADRTGYQPLKIRLTDAGSDETIEYKLEQICYELHLAVESSDTGKIRLLANALRVDERRELYNRLRSYMLAAEVTPRELVVIGKDISDGEIVSISEYGFIYSVNTPRAMLISSRAPGGLPKVPYGYARRNFLINERVLLPSAWVEPLPEGASIAATAMRPGTPVYYGGDSMLYPLAAENSNVKPVGFAARNISQGELIILGVDIVESNLFYSTSEALPKAQGSIAGVAIDSDEMILGGNPGGGKTARIEDAKKSGKPIISTFPGGIAIGCPRKSEEDE